MNEAFSIYFLALPLSAGWQGSAGCNIAAVLAAVVHDVAPPCAATAWTRHGAQPSLLRPSVTSYHVTDFCFMRRLKLVGFIEFC